LNLGVWSWDIRLHKLIYVSSGIETLSGMKIADFQRGFRNWKDLVHPDDLVDFEKNQKELKKGLPSQYQYRIKGENGKIKWVEARTFPVLDSEGDLVRLDGLITDINEKKLQDEKTNYYAFHDYLTDLPNRRMFEAKLEELMMDDAKQFALLYLDLDRFKFVNDTLGHSIGDELLKKSCQKVSVTSKSK
jgi:PAS domain S-box-containing protein